MRFRLTACRSGRPDLQPISVLHKPAGVVTTMRDPAGRRTVADLLPKGPRVVPVGRLDYATDGVLLLTNDGELAHSLLHPRFGVEKTYRATIAGKVRTQDLAPAERRRRHRPAARPRRPRFAPSRSTVAGRSSN